MAARTDRRVEETQRALGDALFALIVAELVVGALLAVCSWWIDGHDELQPATIDRAFRDLAMRGLAPRGGRRDPTCSAG